MKDKIIVFLTLMTAIGVYAKWDMLWVDGNQFCITATNYGVIGHDVLTGAAGGYWPAGYPDENYIYGAGLWFGGLINIDNGAFTDTLVSAGYRPISGVSEYVPGDASDGPVYDNPLERIYNSTNDWPPLNSDSSIVFDSIVSDYDTYALLSDMDPSQHFTSENYPLYILVQQFTYQWDNPILNNTVFIRYVIKNERVDAKDIENAYFSFVIDGDIGNESGTKANDLLGFVDTMTVDYNGVSDTLMHLSTVYQFQLEPETTWTHETHILSATILESPNTGPDSIDLYHNGSYIIGPYSEIGMTSLSQFTLVTDPSTMEKRYQLMAGYNHLYFNPSDPEVSYEPFPSWGHGVPDYPGQTIDSAEAGDKRFCMSCGPFDLPYGDYVAFTVALSINMNPEDIVPNTLTLMEAWQNSTLSIENEMKTEQDADIDVKHSFNKLIIDNSNNNSDMISIMDISGRVVDNIHIHSGINYYYPRNNGIYFVIDKDSRVLGKAVIVK